MNRRRPSSLWYYLQAFAGLIRPMAPVWLVMAIALSALLSSLFSTGYGLLVFQACLLFLLAMSLSFLMCLANLRAQKELKDICMQLATWQVRQPRSMDQSATPWLRQHALYLRAFFHRFISKLQDAQRNLYESAQALLDLNQHLVHDIDEDARQDTFIRLSSDRIADHVASQGQAMGLASKEVENLLANFSSFMARSEAGRQAKDTLNGLLQRLIQIARRINTASRHTMLPLAAEELQLVLHTMDTLHAYSKEVVGLTAATADFQRNTSEMIVQSRQLITTFLQHIRRLEASLSVGEISMEDLFVGARKMKSLNEVINHIVRQSHMLCLNARILAAEKETDTERASGFIVMAADIYALAEKTVTASRKIAAMITTISEQVTDGNTRFKQELRAIGPLSHIAAAFDQLSTRVETHSARCIKMFNTMEQRGVHLEEETAHITKNTAAIDTEVRDIVRLYQTLRHSLEHMANLFGEAAASSNEVHGHLKQFEQVERMLQQKVLAAGDRCKQMSRRMDQARHSAGEANRHAAALARAMDDTGSAKNQLSHTAAYIMNEYHHVHTQLNMFQADTPRRGGELRIAYNPSGGQDWDPAASVTSTFTLLFRAVYDTLVEIRSGPMVRPLLCESVDIKQGRFYRFYLKKNVRFHNGKHLHAEDVRYSFERLRDLDVAAKPMMSMLAHIQGYGDFVQRKQAHLAGIRVIDAHTVDIILDIPLAYFMLMIAQVQFSILPKGFSPQKELPVGTGPFTVTGHQPQKEIALRRNADYHQAPLPYISKISLQYNQTFKDLLANRVDVVPSLFMPDAAEGPEMSKIALDYADAYSIIFLLINTTIPPLDNVLFRQALYLAVDRERLVAEMSKGKLGVLKGFIPPNMLSYRSLRGRRSFDPQKAQALLDQVNGEPKREIHCFGSSNPIFALVGECLAAIGVHLRTHDTQANGTVPLQHTEPFLLLRWDPDYPDPDNILYGLFHSSSIERHGIVSGWRNRTFDALVEKARFALDVDERKRLYSQAEDLLLQELPAVPICFQRSMIAHRASVICPSRSDLPYIDLARAWRLT